MQHLNSTHVLTTTILGLLLGTACSGSGDGTGFGDATGLGGNVANGGGVQQGGSVGTPGSGGRGPVGSGGATVPSSGGNASLGGSVNASTGGTPTATGGKAANTNTGGAATGGKATNSTGGAATGGAATGGKATSSTGGAATGGAATGGAATGGAATGGAATGGAATGGKATGGASTGGAAAGGATSTSSCSNYTQCSSIGASTTVNSTIVVKAGETYDGGCKRFVANASTLGDGSEAEGQEPVFRIENGGTLINVVLGSPAADGIHCYGNATLRNITWQDIGEDAMTMRGNGSTVTLDCGSAVNSADKVFQMNAAGTFRVSNFRANTAGKFFRQNGGTTFKIALFIDRCDISNMSESVARTDSSTSTVSMTNSRYSKIGDTLFIGFDGRITQSGNTSY